MKFVLEPLHEVQCQEGSSALRHCGPRSIAQRTDACAASRLAAVDQGDQLVQICFTRPESMLLDAPVQSNHQVPRFSELRTTSMRASRRRDHRRLNQRMIDSIDQQPGTAVGHAQGFGGRSNGFGFVNGLQEFDFSRADGNDVAGHNTHAQLHFR